MKILQTTAVALSLLCIVGATQGNTAALQPITSGTSSDYFILTHGGHGGHGGHHGGHGGHHGGHWGHHGGHWGHHGGHWGHHGWHGHRGGWWGGSYYYGTCYWNSFGQRICPYYY